MKPIWRSLAVVMVAGRLLGACSSSTGAVANDAWSRPVPPVSDTSAIFLELTNGLDTTIALTGAISEACDAIQLHETSIDEAGVIEMRPLPGGLTLAPGESSVLAPGGIHLMCIAPTVFEGSFEVTLQLTNAADLPVVVAIEDR